MNINDKVQLIGSRSYTGIIKELFYEREKIYCKINWDDNFTSTVNINELNKIKPPLHHDEMIINDEVRIKPGIIHPMCSREHYELSGIIKDIFFKHDRKYCTIQWCNGEITTTLIHYLEKVYNKSKFNSIW